MLDRKSLTKLEKQDNRRSISHSNNQDFEALEYMTMSCICSGSTKKPICGLLFHCLSESASGLCLVGVADCFGRVMGTQESRYLL